MNTTTAFIGGGNMASAIIGGLLKSGRAPGDILVLEPNADQREYLQRELGVITLETPGSVLQRAQTVVWAIKPQNFRLAAEPCLPHIGDALQFSVMAGIRTDTMKKVLGTERIVRSMPNTPALIGQGIAGLYARPAVDDEGRKSAQALLAPTGGTVWVDRESDLDAVTAISGSGPAYVFYFVEAMVQAAEEMGLSAEQGKQLALATFSGAAALAQASPETPAVLRERVTSKGGTTYAALTSMQREDISGAIGRALKAAQRRAVELGNEFGE
jgi:pyrroline-5-carboxylate reductase